MRNAISPAAAVWMLVSSTRCVRPLLRSPIVEVPLHPSSTGFEIGLDLPINLIMRDLACAGPRCSSRLSHLLAPDDTCVQQAVVAAPAQVVSIVYAALIAVRGPHPLKVMVRPGQQRRDVVMAEDASPCEFGPKGLGGGLLDVLLAHAAALHALHGYLPGTEGNIKVAPRPTAFCLAPRCVARRPARC